MATLAATGIGLASTANVSALPINGSAVRDAVSQTPAVTPARYYYYRYHYRPYYRYHYYRYWRRY
jgi:hypothetical protein